MEVVELVVSKLGEFSVGDRSKIDSRKNQLSGTLGQMRVPIRTRGERDGSYSKSYPALNEYRVKQSRDSRFKSFECPYRVTGVLLCSPELCLLDTGREDASINSTRKQWRVLERREKNGTSIKGIERKDRGTKKEGEEE